jgi:hypothetical protein
MYAQNMVNFKKINGQISNIKHALHALDFKTFIEMYDDEIWKI